MKLLLHQFYGHQGKLIDRYDALVSKLTSCVIRGQDIKIQV